MRGLNRTGRWLLALAVIATAPLAAWGGGCSSSLSSVQPDASGQAGSTGAAGTGGQSATAGTSGAAGDGGGAGSGGIGGGAGCSGADAGCCPQCCQGGSAPYCSADDQNLMSCFMVPTFSLPPGCSDLCNTGTYTWVWQAQSCANGCTGRKAPDGGIAGANGGVAGAGGAAACR